MLQMRPCCVVLAVCAVFSNLAFAAKKSGESKPSDGGKIPITTKSDEAKNEFLVGRDLSERLLQQESLAHFDKAIALDSDFALAESLRANSSTTANDFFLHQKKAESLAAKASEGERLLILASGAGVNGDTVKQREYLEKLVAAYPGDERAQYNLATFYFAQQDLDQALIHLREAAKLAPNYSPTYNILGYTYRQQGRYTDAEQAFEKYIDLIPNDPNPYDSYAELLLKMGRFDDSVKQYQKALAIDHYWMAGHVGIACNQMYQGRPQAAKAELERMAADARNPLELRIAYFSMAVLAADDGKLDEALEAMDKEYAVAEKKDDVALMAADLQAMGNILVEVSNYDEAKKKFDRSLQMMQGSDLPQDLKDNAKLLQDYDLAGIAIAQKDYPAAKAYAATFVQGAEASRNSAQIQQAHELAGRIALAEKDYAKAVAELEQSNLQNPRNLYRLGLAYGGKGDTAKEQEFIRKAAAFYSLPQLDYAFIRAQAQQMATNKKGS